MSNRAVVVGGVEWTKADLADRDRFMRETPARVAALRAVPRAELAARVAEQGEAAVALAARVRLATVRAVLSGEAPGTTTTRRTTTRAPAPTTRMLPVLGGRFDDCALEVECLNELLRVSPSAPWASCPEDCGAYQPIDRRAERDELASSRPGCGF